MITVPSREIPRERFEPSTFRDVFVQVTGMEPAGEKREDTGHPNLPEAEMFGVIGAILLGSSALSDDELSTGADDLDVVFVTRSAIPPDNFIKHVRCAYDNQFRITAGDDGRRRSRIDIGFITLTDAQTHPARLKGDIARQPEILVYSYGDPDIETEIGRTIKKIKARQREQRG